MSNLGELNKTILLEIVGCWLGLSDQERKEWQSISYVQYIESIIETSEEIDPIQNLRQTKFGSLFVLCVETLELIDDYIAMFGVEKVIKLTNKLREEL